MYNKSDGSPYRCPNKVQSFDSFKQHLGHAERTLGENIGKNCKLFIHLNYN